MYYYLFILAIALERLVELIVSRRNAEWSLAQGGREFGRGHYPVMTTMHTLFLVCCVAEVWALHRPFIPWLGWPMLLVVVASTITRWWCATVLGRHWNPRVIVIPGAPLVRRGPYKWMHHPNYTAVVAEVAALPLMHSAWITAIVFTAANALVLNTRIRIENKALGYA